MIEPTQVGPFSVSERKAAPFPGPLPGGAGPGSPSSGPSGPGRPGRPGGPSGSGGPGGPGRPEHEVVEDGRQAPQLVEMGRGEAAQPVLTVLGQGDPGETPVHAVTAASHHPERLGPVHQLNHAVVAQQQIPSQLGDRGVLVTGMALDRDKELVLGRGEPDRPGFRLAPVQETPEAGTERQQGLVVGG